jgi:sterol 24-C-methyltransferase
MTTKTDGRVDSRIQNYTGFWQKDTQLDSPVDTDTRVENYKEVINGEIDSLYAVYTSDPCRLL